MLSHSPGAFLCADYLILLGKMQDKSCSLAEQGVAFCWMEPDIGAQIAAAIKAERQRIASAGGQGRAKSLSASERKRIATKASKAAAKARTARAKANKQKSRRERKHAASDGQ